MVLYSVVGYRTPVETSPWLMGHSCLKSNFIYLSILILSDSDHSFKEEGDSDLEEPDDLSEYERKRL